MSHHTTTPASGPIQHRQGCDALGGYGHGVGSCTCGAVEGAQPHSAAEHNESLPWAAHGEVEIILGHSISEDQFVRICSAMSRAHTTGRPSPAASAEFGDRFAANLFSKRRGRGGAPVGHIRLTQADLANIIAVSFDEGARAALQKR